MNAVFPITLLNMKRDQFFNEILNCLFDRSICDMYERALKYFYQMNVTLRKIFGNHEGHLLVKQRVALATKRPSIRYRK